ncbi:hypothetical protein AMATHDRAFT_69273 [Amanita thiersii Skay4041]|uniref:PH domain-containing protein n=1 Tax=Amanita thiersii Skay4041 TaxID=703135 RepID=A0A2A9NEL0_9AGAR|nr:hypothetical protein AMATHDRAFT_69273 [Amanita thiersii Skay4041]
MGITPEREKRRTLTQKRSSYSQGNFHAGLDWGVGSGAGASMGGMGASLGVFVSEEAMKIRDVDLIGPGDELARASRGREGRGRAKELGRNRKFEWVERWIVIKNGTLYICKDREDVHPNRRLGLSSLSEIRGRDHLSSYLADTKATIQSRRRPSASTSHSSFIPPFPFNPSSSSTLANKNQEASNSHKNNNALSDLDSPTQNGPAGNRNKQTKYIICTKFRSGLSHVMATTTTTSQAQDPATAVPTATVTAMRNRTLPSHTNQPYYHSPDRDNIGPSTSLPSLVHHQYHYSKKQAPPLPGPALKQRPSLHRHHSQHVAIAAAAAAVGAISPEPLTSLLPSTELDVLRSSSSPSSPPQLPLSLQNQSSQSSQQQQTPVTPGGTPGISRRRSATVASVVSNTSGGLTPGASSMMHRSPTGDGSRYVSEAELSRFDPVSKGKEHEKERENDDFERCEGIFAPLDDVGRGAVGVNMGEAGTAANSTPKPKLSLSFSESEKVSPIQFSSPPTTGVGIGTNAEAGVEADPGAVSTSPKSNASSSSSYNNMSSPIFAHSSESEWEKDIYGVQGRKKYPYHYGYRPAFRWNKGKGRTKEGKGGAGVGAGAGTGTGGEDDSRPTRDVVREGEREDREVGVNKVKGKEKDKRKGKDSKKREKSKKEKAKDKEKEKEKEGRGTSQLGPDELAHEWIILDLGNLIAYNSILRVLHRHVPPVNSTFKTNFPYTIHAGSDQSVSPLHAAKAAPSSPKKTRKPERKSEPRSESRGYESSASSGGLLSSHDPRSKSPTWNERLGILPYPEWRVNTMKRAQKAALGGVGNAMLFYLFQSNEFGEEEALFQEAEEEREEERTPATEDAALGPLLTSQLESPQKKTEEEKKRKKTKRKSAQSYASTITSTRPNGSDSDTSMFYLDMISSEENSEIEWHGWMLDLSRQAKVQAEQEAVNLTKRPSSVLDNDDLQWDEAERRLALEPSGTVTAVSISSPAGSTSHEAARRMALVPRILSGPSSSVSSQPPSHSGTDHHPLSYYSSTSTPPFTSTPLSSPSSSESLSQRRRMASLSPPRSSQLMRIPGGSAAGPSLYHSTSMYANLMRTDQQHSSTLPPRRPSMPALTADSGGFVMVPTGSSAAAVGSTGGGSTPPAFNYPEYFGGGGGDIWSSSRLSTPGPSSIGGGPSSSSSSIQRRTSSLGLASPSMMGTTTITTITATASASTTGSLGRSSGFFSPTGFWRKEAKEKENEGRGEQGERDKKGRGKGKGKAGEDSENRQQEEPPSRRPRLSLLSSVSPGVSTSASASASGQSQQPSSGSVWLGHGQGHTEPRSPMVKSPTSVSFLRRARSGSSVPSDEDYQSPSHNGSGGGSSSGNAVMIVAAAAAAATAVTTSVAPIAPGATIGGGVSGSGANQRKLERKKRV